MLRHLVALAALALVACDAPPTPEDALPYESCIHSSGHGLTCADEDSVCTATTTWPVYAMCTWSCLEDADCPAHEDGRAARCEPFANGERVCVLPCDANAEEDDCPAGTTCTLASRLDGTPTSQCLPD